MKKFFPGAIGLGLCLALTAPAWPLGLAMKFVDITLENVDPGDSFNLRVLKNLPLVLINQDKTREIYVTVETVIPHPNELKQGYESIPDPSWVRILPSQFTLGPGASASADIVVTIPSDPKYMGHHYEVVIWSHTEPNKNKGLSGGVSLQVGLRARLRMSIGTVGPETMQHEKIMNKLALINTNFSIRPDNSFIEDVPVGRTVDLKKEKKASLKIVNEADDPVELVVKAVAAQSNIRPQAGFENAPDPTWLEVDPVKNKVAGNTIKEVKLRVHVPDKPEFRGKKYMFLLQTSLADETLPLAYYNMVYINTEP